MALSKRLIFERGKINAKKYFLEVPQQFEKDLRQEMQTVALEAFKAVASRHTFAEYMKRKDAAQYLGISTGYLDQLTAKVCRRFY